MKLLVISDTHGRITPVWELLQKKKDFDLLIHLGDVEEDAHLLAEDAGLDLVVVPGNMDGAFDLQSCVQELQTEAGKILLTHGHIFGVSSSEEQLVAEAKKRGCVGVFYGHTHRSTYQEKDGLVVINPGSASRPRDGNPPSYAIVHTRPEGLEGSILYFTEKGSTPQRSSQNGRWHRMLNYSDRF